MKVIAFRKQKEKGVFYVCPYCFKVLKTDERKSFVTDCAGNKYTVIVKKDLPYFIETGKQVWNYPDKSDWWWEIICPNCSHEGNVPKGTDFKAENLQLKCPKCKALFFFSLNTVINV